MKSLGLCQQFFVSGVMMMMIHTLQQKDRLWPQGSHSDVGRLACEQACSCKTVMSKYPGEVAKDGSLGELGWVQFAEAETEDSASFFSKIFKSVAIYISLGPMRRELAK